MMTISAAVYIDPQRGSKPYNRMIFGQFLEHFHRQVYGGVFEPGSPLADADGFRTDVIAALRELRVPVVRWPGGCFVSAYHWQDGVGLQRRACLRQSLAGRRAQYLWHGRVCRLVPQDRGGALHLHQCRHRHRRKR